MNGGGPTTRGPKSKKRDIRDRSFQYALRAIKLFRFLQRSKDAAAGVLGKQYLRVATSIGANIEEGQSGESKSDFIHKYALAQKEARESLYWLRLISESGIVPKRRLQPLMKESEEIFAVVTAIIVSAKGEEKCQLQKAEANTAMPDKAEVAAEGKAA